MGKLKTLIVDESPVFRQSLKGMLEAQFPQIVFEEAADGKEAMEKVHDFSPALVFTALNLTGENGLELTKKIKGCDSQIVVIIWSTYDLDEYQQASQQCGADYVLSKSFVSGKEIALLVESVLSTPDGPTPDSS